MLFENAEFVTCALMDENAFAAEANLVAALPVQLNLSNILKSQRPSIFPSSICQTFSKVSALVYFLYQVIA